MVLRIISKFLALVEMLPISKLNLPDSWSDDELRLIQKLRSVRIDEPRSSWFDQART